MARFAVAIVWLYQGLACKLLLADPGHLDVLRSVPFLGERHALLGLRVIGALETGLALWVFSGWRPFTAAAVQTVLLIAMNGGGLLWAGEAIPAPGAMLTQNLVFLSLVWIVAGRAAAAQAGAGSWRRGRLDRVAGLPQVIFGWSYEDPAIELAVFPPGGRVFCIAAAGDTAIALSRRGDHASAVDLNPAQVDYARGRAAGMPARWGVIERRLAIGRRGFRWLGLREGDLTTFLSLDDLEKQARVWREQIVTWRLRAFLRIALHPAVLRLFYPKELVAFLPRRFDRVLLGRLERTFARHPNRENRWAWRILLGSEPLGQTADAPREAALKPEFLCADAAAYLESCPPATFDGISLSNLLDALSPTGGTNLLNAARRAAKPRAKLVLRRFGEPRDPTAATWAARDRSPLWGAIEVLEVQDDGSSAPLPL